MMIDELQWIQFISHIISAILFLYFLFACNTSSSIQSFPKMNPVFMVNYSNSFRIHPDPHLRKIPSPGTFLAGRLDFLSWETYCHPAGRVSFVHQCNGIHGYSARFYYFSQSLCLLISSAVRSSYNFASGRRTDKGKQGRPSQWIFQIILSPDIGIRLMKCKYAR